VTPARFTLRPLLSLPGWAAQAAALCTQVIALPGTTLAAASSFSSLSISAAAFVLGQGRKGCCSARTQLIAQTGVTLATASGFSSLSISAAAFALGLSSTGCCSARSQLIALTGVTLAATSGFG
jgi:hypothetical protein